LAVAVGLSVGCMQVLGPVAMGVMGS
jgi:hypothetical protein